MRLFKLISIIFLLAGNLANAQETPIGYWTSHFPYHEASSVASDGQTLFVAAGLAFFTHNTITGETETYSKVNGMADVGMAWVAYDNTTDLAILTYTNGNIDLFKDGAFYNLPDFKIRVINGPKQVFGIHTENGLAYISTSIGILVIDLAKKEIKETWEFTQNQITKPVLSFSTTSSHLYATTPEGVYRISRTSPSPQVFSLWEKLSTRIIGTAATVNNKLFLANNDSVFVLEQDTLRGIFNLGSGGHHLDAGNGKLLICNWSALQIMNPETYGIESASFHQYTNQGVALANGQYWVADLRIGLGTHSPTPSYIVPNGPRGSGNFDIYAYDRNVLVAHGGTNDKWNPVGPSSFNPDGFSEYKDGQWKSYGASSGYAPMDTLRDFLSVIKDRADGTIYAGSYVDGLFILRADGTHQLLRQNSPIEQNINNPGTWATAGLAIDDNGTLWVSVFGATNELAAKTAEGNWYKFGVPFNMVLPNAASNVIIDDVGQKWFISPLGSGVIVYNDQGTLENPSDDTYRQFLAGTGAGNLPNNDVYSIAKDKNNAIWVGTRAGIGIINCAEVATTEPCDAERPIVQFDQFAGYLFETEVVYAIAVDGANRKWVGTANGVWLLSPTGEKIVYRFTAENSPLPSNQIRKITIDPVTGDVYIGTDKGMVCYRSTATDGGETNDEQLVSFPNPVPSGYGGTIAIKGFVENADVRITDLSGQLVYHTTALGGQAVWNGLDYKGRRPQSGVYLVFGTNKDGTETAVGKIVFMQ